MDEKKFSEGLILMQQTNLIVQEIRDSLEKTFFTKPEILEIISAIKENYMHLLWFKFLYSFGMNLHELVNLKIKDIDFEKAKLKIGTSKKLTTRYLDIPKALLCDLRIQCNSRLPECYVFQGRSGKLHTRTIQKALEKVELKLNKQLTIAKLRKSIAVHLLQSGWEYKEIGEFLGHAHYRATKNLLGPRTGIYMKIRLPLDDILK